MKTRKKLRKYNLEQVLTTGGGGLSDLIPKPQPSPSLAPEDIQKQSLALAQRDCLAPSTPRGNQPLNNGKKPVLTESSVSTIPNSTLAATVNWALKVLQRKGLVKFGIGANGKYYYVRFSTSIWSVENNVLTLKNDVSTITSKEDTK
jgi:hypothetical protein